MPKGTKASAMYDAMTNKSMPKGKATRNSQVKSSKSKKSSSKKGMC